MGGPGRAQAHPLGRQAHPLGSQAQLIRISFSPQGFITEIHTPPLHQLSRWLVSDDLAGEEAECGGPGLTWLQVVCVCEAGWTYSQIFENNVGDSLRERNYNLIIWQQLCRTFLQSACQLHIPSNLETSLALCCVTKLHTLEWPLFVPITRCTCVMIMLFNQLLDMPHLSGRWIILAKAKCLLTGM